MNKKSKNKKVKINQIIAEVFVIGIVCALLTAITGFEVILGMYLCTITIVGLILAMTTLVLGYLDAEAQERESERRARIEIQKSKMEIARIEEKKAQVFEMIVQK